MRKINNSPESKEGYNPLPEIVGHLDRRPTQIPVEELVTQGELIKLQQIRGNPKLHRKSEHGFTLLRHAAKENKIETLEFLLSKRCDIDAEDDDEQRALHTAAMFSHAEFMMMMILLEKGADVNICNDFGNTPLHFAIINGGDVKVVETLSK